jgi:hypothetical protein
MIMLSGSYSRDKPPFSVLGYDSSEVDGNDDTECPLSGRLTVCPSQTAGLFENIQIVNIKSRNLNEKR